MTNPFFKNKSRFTERSNFFRISNRFDSGFVVSFSISQINAITSDLSMYKPIGVSKYFPLLDTRSLAPSRKIVPNWS